MTLTVAVTLAVGAEVGSRAVAEPAHPAVAWLQRSYALTSGEAQQRIAAEHASEDVANVLLRALGDDAAGAWLEPATGGLVVGVVDPGALAKVRAANARPVLVTRSARVLQQVQRRLDAYAARQGAGRVVSWYVDLPENAVVVDVAGPAGRSGRSRASGAATQAFLTLARSFGDAVRIQQVRGATTTQERLSAGQEIDTDDNRLCAVGFNAQDGAGRPVVLTAGHCGRGTSTFSRNGQLLGHVRAAQFPSDDFSVVSLDNDAVWDAQPLVERYGYSPLPVRGYSTALVGSTVCKAGATTHWTCGQVVAHDVTVQYDDGDTVYGLTQASTCSRSGDSGGPLMAGSYAQGLLSGGRSIDGQCLEGYGRDNVSFFQPVSEVLARYDLRLLTAG